MPIYLYKCHNCSAEFDTLRKHGADTSTHACQKCGGIAHKVVTAPYTIFKGHGFYATDYKTKA